jgi:hypothetical protein
MNETKMDKPCSGKLNAVEKYGQAPNFVKQLH